MKKSSKQHDETDKLDELLELVQAYVNEAVEVCDLLVRVHQGQDISHDELALEIVEVLGDAERQGWQRQDALRCLVSEFIRGTGIEIASAAEEYHRAGCVGWRFIAANSESPPN